MLKWSFIVIVTAYPPAGFSHLGVDAGRTYAIQKCDDLLLVVLLRALDDHGKLVVRRAQVEMMFPDKGRQVTQITKGQEHPYSGEQYGQLERNRYPCGQIEVRFTADVYGPVRVEDPAYTGESRSGTRDPVDKAGGVQAGVPETQGFVHTMDGHRRVYIMDLVSSGTDLLDRGEQHFLVRENPNYKFFNCHIYSFLLLVF